MRLTSMTNTTDNPNPLILLDIDGVINDLNALGGLDRDWGIDQVYSHGHMVHIPDYMGWLIRQLTDVAEVHWCTTWRHRANDEIAEHLGIDQLPVVDDGTKSRFV
ncbi:MAG: domain in Swiss Army Knife repair protein, partial [Actinomycetota bacterium]